MFVFALNSLHGQEGDTNAQQQQRAVAEESQPLRHANDVGFSLQQDVLAVAWAKVRVT